MLILVTKQSLNAELEIQAALFWENCREKDVAL